MQTDDDCIDVKSDTERAEGIPAGTPRTNHVMSQDTSLDDESIKLAEAAAVPLPCDAEDSNDDENKEAKIEEVETAGMFLFLSFSNNMWSWGRPRKRWRDNLDPYHKDWF